MSFGCGPRRTRGPRSRPTRCRSNPPTTFINWQQDAFGNFLARLVFPNRARSLTITVGLIADMKVINPFDFFIEDWAERIPFGYPRRSPKTSSHICARSTRATRAPARASCRSRG